MVNSGEDKKENSPELPRESAEAVGEHGGRVWRRGEFRKRNRRAEYIAAIIVNAILIYIFNNLLKWRVPFLTSDFNLVLWAVNLSLGATIIANILFLAYDARWFHHLLQLVLNILAFLSTYLLYRIFPLAFSERLIEQVVRIALIFAMVALGIALIVEFFRLVFGRD